MATPIGFALELADPWVTDWPWTERPLAPDVVARQNDEVPVPALIPVIGPPNRLHSKGGQDCRPARPGRRRGLLARRVQEPHTQRVVALVMDTLGCKSSRDDAILLSNM